MARDPVSLEKQDRVWISCRRFLAARGQKIFGDIGLQRCKAEAPRRIAIDYELHTRMAQVAHAIKKHNRLFEMGGLGRRRVHRTTLKMRPTRMFGNPKKFIVCAGAGSPPPSHRLSARTSREPGTAAGWRAARSNSVTAAYVFHSFHRRTHVQPCMHPRPFPFIYMH